MHRVWLRAPLCSLVPHIVGPLVRASQGLDPDLNPKASMTGPLVHPSRGQCEYRVNNGCRVGLSLITEQGKRLGLGILMLWECFPVLTSRCHLPSLLAAALHQRCS